MDRHLGLFWPATQTSLAKTGSLSGDGSTWRIDFSDGTIGVREFRDRVLGHGVAGEPATWHGTIAHDGEPRRLTLVRVQKQPVGGYSVINVIEGGHLAGDEHVTALRWKVAGAQLAGSSTVSNQHPIETPLGNLSIWPSAQTNNGLELELSVKLTVFQVRALVSQINMLWEIAMGRRNSAGRISFKIESDCAWYKLWDATEKSWASVDGDLFQAHEISVQQVARWMSSIGPLGRVSSMTRRLPVPLEAQVQIYATALEGLHRNGCDDLGGVSLSNSSLRSLRHAVRAAIREIPQSDLTAEDRERICARATTEINHWGDPTYRERLVELLAPIDDLAPGLFGPKLADWAESLALLRNAQAHVLAQSKGYDHDRLGVREEKLYLAYLGTSRWALRLALLARVFSPEEIRNRLAFNRSGFLDQLTELDQLQAYGDEYSSVKSYEAACLTRKAPTASPCA